MLLSSPPPDINECAQGLHNCSQLCTNTPGAHACRCRPGFHPLDPAASHCLGEYLQAAGPAAHGCPPPHCCQVSHASRDAASWGAQLCSPPWSPPAQNLGGKTGRRWLFGSWWSEEASAAHPAAVGTSSGRTTAAWAQALAMTHLHPTPWPDKPRAFGAAPTLSPSFLDVDECQAQPGPCDHICHNSLGSFHCHCHHGFSLGAGGHCQCS